MVDFDILERKPKRADDPNHRIVSILQAYMRYAYFLYVRETSKL